VGSLASRFNIAHLTIQASGWKYEKQAAGIVYWLLLHGPQDAVGQLAQSSKVWMGSDRIARRSKGEEETRLKRFELPTLGSEDRCSIH
jgi:hypothetical protein